MGRQPGAPGVPGRLGPGAQHPSDGWDPAPSTSLTAGTQSSAPVQWLGPSAPSTLSSTPSTPSDGWDPESSTPLTVGTWGPQHPVRCLGPGAQHPVRKHSLVPQPDDLGLGVALGPAGEEDGVAQGDVGILRLRRDPRPFCAKRKADPLVLVLNHRANRSPERAPLVREKIAHVQTKNTPVGTASGEQLLHGEDGARAEPQHFQDLRPTARPLPPDQPSQARAGHGETTGLPGAEVSHPHTQGARTPTTKGWS